MKSFYIVPLFLMAASLSNVYAESSPNYQLIDTIHIGGSGGWDYVRIDAEQHRLYAAHASKVEVVDTRSGQLLGAIEGVNNAHGVAIDHALGKGFITSGKDNTVLVFGLNDLKVRGRIAVGMGPDALVFDPTTEHVFCDEWP